MTILIQILSAMIFIWLGAGVGFNLARMQRTQGVIQDQHAKLLMLYSTLFLLTLIIYELMAWHILFGTNRP